MDPSPNSRIRENSRTNSGQHSRRDVLRLGGLGALNLFWSDWLRGKPRVPLAARGPDRSS